jgi:hypothetical protein
MNALIIGKMNSLASGTKFSKIETKNILMTDDMALSLSVILQRKMI